MRCCEKAGGLLSASHVMPAPPAATEDRNLRRVIAEGEAFVGPAFLLMASSWRFCPKKKQRRLLQCAVPSVTRHAVAELSLALLGPAGSCERFPCLWLSGCSAAKTSREKESHYDRSIYNPRNVMMQRHGRHLADLEHRPPDGGTGVSRLASKSGERLICLQNGERRCTFDIPAPLRFLTTIDSHERRVLL